MSKLKVIAALLLVTALLLVPASAFAQAKVCGFYGSVTLDGSAVADGTAVKAWIDGAEVASVTTTDSKYGYAPAVFRIDGEYADKAVEFTVGADDAPAGTANWSAGENINLDLAGITPPPDAEGEAAVALTPDSGLGAVVVSGSNFTPNSTVTITWDDADAVTVPATVTVDLTGAFSAIITIPEMDAGDYAIVATDAQGRSDEATFQVISASGIATVEVEILGSEDAATADLSNGVLSLGLPASQGPAGTDGVDGQDGAAGAAGAAGADGKDGENAAGGIALPLIAIILAVVAIILVFVLRPKPASA